jgi:hypothetical protein
VATTYQKAVKRLRQKAAEQEWREKEKTCGWMLLAPDGENQVMVHKTASDPHAFGNLLSEMRRYGFVWEDR